MKITFILPAAYMSGGIRVVAIYASALSCMGHNVVLIAPPPKSLNLKAKLKSLLKGHGWPTSHRIKSHLDSVDVDYRILNKWRPIVDSDVPDADVVIATWWQTAEQVMNLSDCKGAKVYFIQGYETYSYLPIERCKSTYKMPFHKIVVAKWLLRLMRKDYADQNIDLVLNSIDHSQFFSEVRYMQARPTVGFLYSTSSCKGVDITLKVISNLQKKFNNLRVVSFGSKKPIDNNELGNMIEFYHLPEQNKIREIYSQCDVWITASRIEGFNLTAMEAMACRTPVVSTKAGWPEDAIENKKNGMLVDVDDVEAITAGVENILSLSKDEWSVMSENAYKTVENSSWDASAKFFEQALLNACCRANKGEIAGDCLDHL